jgi:hypothetical protein
MYFYIAITAVVGGLFIYFALIFINGSKGTGKPPSEDSRRMYFETFKTLVTAAGLAIPILAATMKEPASATDVSRRSWMLVFAVGYMLASGAFGILTMLEMSRLYEKSRQRGSANSAGVWVSDGLTQMELGWLSLVAFGASAFFFVGLLYVVRFMGLI